MVATTRSRSPLQPRTTQRRSFTGEPPLIENASCRGRRHSVAVALEIPAVSLTSEVRSPRSLKDYEAELQQAQVLDGDAPRERTKRPSSTVADSDLLPRKLLHLNPQPPRAPRRSIKEHPPFELEIIGPHHESTQPLLSDVLEGFQARVAPVAVDDGTGGVYFLRTKAQRIAAVFKPADEEPFAINNPKVHRPHQGGRTEYNNNTDSSEVPEQVVGIRGGIAPGVAAIREVAAYLLDHGHRAGVPPTVFVAAQHPVFFVRRKTITPPPRKVGSLQQYVRHDCTADDISEGLLPVERVHALAILDMRLANQDRHGGNVLVVGSRQTRQYDLVPIDHGACLPRITSMEETSFLWLSWPQARVPFSADTKAFIASLDGIRDAEQLISLLPAPYQVESEALLTLAVCTVLLQVCVLQFEMTAHGTALLMCRDDASEPSVLEQIVSACLSREKQDIVWSKQFAEKFTRALRVRLEAFLRSSSAI